MLIAARSSDDSMLTAPPVLKLQNGSDSKCAKVTEGCNGCANAIRLRTMSWQRPVLTGKIFFRCLPPLFFTSGQCVTPVNAGKWTGGGSKLREVVLE